MTPAPALAAAAAAYLMESAPVLAVRLGAGGEITALSAHAERVLGPAVLGRSFSELLVDFAPPADLRTLSATAHQPHMLALNTAAGVPETYYFRFFPLGEGTLALGCLDALEQDRLRREVLDLNRELNNLARQLHLANAELQELNQLKNRFLGMAAHDLRRPLGAILIYAQFLRDEAGGQLSAEHQGFLDTCLRSAGSMQRLIDDFLDVSMIESGRLRLNLAPTGVGEILAPVIELGGLQAARKHVSLLVAHPPVARGLMADAPKLQQVLLNLVGNAIEHSAAGQRVWLGAQWEPRSLVLTVRDEGPGLSAEARARLFTPFAQLPERRSPAERHAGLGLAIAHQIVEAHGGTIRVESAPGQGVALAVTLPVDHEDSGSSPFPPAA